MNKESSGALYGLGFVGALVFYIQQASTVGGWLIGLIKALIWPAIIVYKFLGM